MIYFLVLLLLVGSWWLPWWWVGPLFFLVGRSAKTGRKAFANGFFALLLVWGPLSYYSDLKSFGLIGKRVAGMFSLPWAWSSYFLIAICGGLFAGIWGYFGYSYKRYMGYKNYKEKS